MNHETAEVAQEKNKGLIDKIYGKETEGKEEEMSPSYKALPFQAETSEISQVETMDKYSYAETIEEEETLSLHDKEVEMIKQALIRTGGRRKNAAKELGISERTLYRKIKQHNLGDVTDV
jgi:DNA-binding NtrC family response regulator